MQANSIMSLAGAADCDIPILTKLAQKVGTAASAMESTGERRSRFSQDRTRSSGQAAHRTKKTTYSTDFAGVKSLKLAKNNIVEDCGLYGNSVRPRFLEISLCPVRSSCRALCVLLTFLLVFLATRFLTGFCMQCAADQFYAE